MKAQVTVVSAALILGLVVSISGTVLHVPDEYPTIQAGIDAATLGDTVLVADGTYTGDGNRDLDFGGVNMVVMSENGPEVTIIDCEGSPEEPHRGFHFHHGENASSVVRGFTIRGGRAGGSWWENSGGGIFCEEPSSPTIVGNTISGNRAGSGGGIRCLYSSATITNNRIIGNMGTWGGGIECYADYSVATPIIADNTIIGNTASNVGGGIACYWGCSPTITGNTIAKNWSDSGGGGIFVCGDCYPTIADNTIAENGVAGGLWGGGGICSVYYAAVTVLNCALWGDSADVGPGPEIYVGTPQFRSSLTISYSDVQGGSLAAHVSWGCTLNWGEGNIDEDPMFVLAEMSDYRLLWNSPCIDAGHPDSLDPDATRSDMGAHFFDQDDYTTLYLTPDTTEASPGGVLGVTYTAINRWAQPEPFWVLTEAILPNGNPFTIMGPDQYALPAETTVQQHLTHNVPGVAPSGVYGYRSRIGVPPSTLYDEDRFMFAVVEP